MIQTTIAPTTFSRNPATPSVTSFCVQSFQLMAHLALRSAPAREIVQIWNPPLQDGAQSSILAPAVERAVRRVAEPRVLRAERPGDVFLREADAHHLDVAGVFRDRPRHLRDVAHDQVEPAL